MPSKPTTENTRSGRKDFHTGVGHPTITNTTNKTKANTGGEMLIIVKQDLQNTSGIGGTSSLDTLDCFQLVGNIMLLTVGMFQLAACDVAGVGG